jgi:murein L,D-transpeptidase YafK
MTMSNLLRWILISSTLAIVAAIAVSGIYFVLPVQAPVTKPTIDYIVVEKHLHLMRLFNRGSVIRTYRVALGRGGKEAKSMAGDNKVPEGIYRITGRNPRSAFHLSLRVGYPTEQQRNVAQRLGVDPGGDVMIHGIRNGLGWLGGLHRKLDWTRGCIAVTDAEIEEIWTLVPDGIQIEIRA